MPKTRVAAAFYNKISQTFARGRLGLPAFRHPVQIPEDSLLEAGHANYAEVLHCFYKTAFGRLADLSGYSYWLERLNQGLPLKDLAEQLEASPEFRARHGNFLIIGKEYITALYVQGLEREPDHDGLAFWLNTEERGGSRADALLAVASSAEALEKHRANIVNRLYRLALDRPVDQSGLIYSLQKLRTGVPLDILAKDILASPEYAKQYGSKRRTAEFIVDLYRNGLSRIPNLSETASWLKFAKNGATHAEILVSFVTSPETSEALFPAEDAELTYNSWIALYNTVSEVDRVVIRTHLAGLSCKPLFSIIIPVFEKSGSDLEKTVFSLSSQLYSCWELWICVNSTVHESWPGGLQDRVSNDPRIRLIYSERDETLAELSNAGLCRFTGDFVGIIPPGDILREDAFYQIASELAADSRAEIIYTDCDEIDRFGRRQNPWFKPGWDPDLILTQDYLSNFVIYRRELIEKVGAIRTQFPGTEFHQLVLRASALTTHDLIRHIPDVLYHRGNQLLNNVYNYSVNTERFLREHLNEQGNKNANLEIVQSNPKRLRIVWPLPKQSPLVSVIIPTRDRADLLNRCVQGILHRTNYSNLEILIINNGSVEAATHALFHRLIEGDTRVRVLDRPGPFNYSALNNSAAEEAKGTILLLVNNDVDVMHAEWLREMVSQVLRPDVGIVGAKLLYADDRLQHGGVVLGPKGAAIHLHGFTTRDDPGYFGQLAFARTLSVVTAACAAIRREVFFEVGGFNQTELRVSFNDVDLCLRIGDYGYRVVWTPFAQLRHLESASRGLDHADPAKARRAQQEALYLQKTWGSLLETDDPFHNPNVVLHTAKGTIPAVPRREKPWYFLLDRISELNAMFP
ncbi:MAG: DUF4214 domain-containing protein [Verrucomicrobia bacterium]|nr:DUF4214 domain-containing protein [Verrucomicrobiota bacterium]